MTGLASAFPAYAEADWRKAAEAALKGASLETLVSKTSDAIAFGPLAAGRTGPRAMRADGGPWKIMARIDHPHPGDANAQALEDLASGADGLRIVFSGAGGAHGFGLAKWDSAALHAAFEGVRFDADIHIELDLGVESEAQARNFAALVARSGAEPSQCFISFGLDPLGALARSGKRSRGWAEEAGALAASVAALRGDGFRGPFVVADGRAVHDAGGTPAQELAFALGAGVAYLRALSERGGSLDAARAAIALRLAADADQLVTISKFRAMRLLWGRVQEACGLAPAPVSLQAETAWRVMTARDPYVNVMRSAMGAFSAGIGGADSVCVLPFSQAVGLPDAFARRLARNTQLIELRESHLGFVADPAAGAGGFETLTQALCEKAWALFQTWEALGGLPEAIVRGEVQKIVAASAAALARDAARLKAPITGVSAHPDIREVRIDTSPATPSRVEFPGEAFAPPMAPMRLSAPFERLRDAAEAISPKPAMFLAAMGPLAAHARRVGFAREFLEAGGIAVLADAGAAAAADSAERFVQSGAAMACLCGADEAYAQGAADFARALKAVGAKHVILAGRPGEHEAAWREAGIDGFIFAGADAPATLENLLRQAGANL